MLRCFHLSLFALLLCAGAASPQDRNPPPADDGHWTMLRTTMPARASARSRIKPLPAAAELPFYFSSAMAVRKDDGALEARLNGILERRAPEIHALLEGYGVPLMPEAWRPQ